MDIVRAEITGALQPPVSKTDLVIFSDNDIIHSSKLAVYKHLQLCSEYAQSRRVFLVSCLFVKDHKLCLALFDDEGREICRQGALYLTPRWITQGIVPDDTVRVTPTKLGHIALSVDGDITRPQTARAAALKGADIIICSRQLDPAENTPELTMRTFWDGAQTNGLYLVGLTGTSAVVTCPAPLTRARDGFLIRRTSTLPLCFGLNFDRLEQVRQRFAVIEQLNSDCAGKYQRELRR